MKFSIIVPVYNVEEYVEKCLNSVLSQNFDDYELIVVNDGSTDNSSAVVEKIRLEHPDKIRVIEQENKGLSGARNTGIDNAKGDFLIFLDSDDTLAEGALDGISKKIEETNADMVIFDFVKEDENGSLIEYVKAIDDDRELFTLKEYPQVIFAPVSACNKVTRKEIFEKAGVSFPERQWFEDLSTSINILPYCSKIAYIGKGYYRYLQRQGSIMHSSNVERNLEIITASRGVADFYKEKGLFEAYKDEITYLLVLNAYVVASVRVIKNKGNKDILKQIKEYIYSQFPDFHTNKYILNMSKKEKLIIKLLDSDNFALLSILLRIKEMRKR